MATDNGYLGSVYSGSTKIGELNSWDITFDGGVVDVSAFGDRFSKKSYTVTNVTGNFAGNSDKSDTTQNALISQFLSGGTPAAVWLYLYVSGSTGYYGEACVTPGRSATRTDKQKYSSSFEGTGTWYQNIA